MRYKNIFFDLDGTLSESHEGIYASLNYMYGEIGLPPPVERYNRFIGPPVLKVLREEFGFSEEGAAEAYAHFRKHSNEKGMYMAWPYPGVIDMLGALKAAGKRMYVATARRSEIARRCVENLGLIDYMSDVFSLDYERGVLTKEEILKDAVKKLIDVPSAVMVGDRAVDIEGGKAVGFATIYVEYGYGGPEEAGLCNAGFIAPSVSALKKELMK